MHASKTLFGEKLTKKSAFHLRQPKKVRFQFMDDHRKEFPLVKMAEVLGVTRAGYYAWKSRPESGRARRKRRLEILVKAYFWKMKERYGSPRLTREINNRGHNCSQGLVTELMKKNGLRAKAKKKFKATTDSTHPYPVSPNLLEQDFSVNCPGEVFVSDITYLRTDEGWMYLCIVMDLFNREISGWAVQDRLTADIAVKALNRAFRNRVTRPDAIFHSDRGIQYASNEFRESLAKYDLFQSMSRKGCCWDNAPAESFFHTLKTEEVCGNSYISKKECKMRMFEYIEIFYNRERMHSELGYRTPVGFAVDYMMGLMKDAA